MRLGELGAGLTVADVTEKLIRQCANSTTCTLDMTALDLPYENQVLRVEWFCSCLPGYYNRAPGEGLTGTCEPCGSGTYKAAGMNDCKASVAGGMKSCRTVCLFTCLLADKCR